MNYVLILALALSASAQVFSDASFICSLDIAIRDILCCNLDGNEYDDILLSPYPFGNMILIMNSQTGFSEPVSLSWSGNNMRASDFNGDGLDDIATGISGPLLFSNGDGTFTPSDYSLFSCTVPEDFNGDGMADILMGSGTDIYLALNQNWGESFETVWSDTVPSWPGVHAVGFITGDIAGDSYTDFAVIHSYGLRVFVAQGGSTSFYLAEYEDDLYTYLDGSPPYAQCDINNDGHPDLLNSGWDIYPSPPPPIYVSIWENDPGAWYWTLSGINANYEPKVESCDFDGDGYDEIVYSNYDGPTVIQGTAAGPGTVMFSDSDCGCDCVGFGHLAGGANPDLISYNLISAGQYSLFWYENNLTSLDQDQNAEACLCLSVSSNPFSGSVRISSPIPGSFRIMDCQGRLVGTGAGSFYDFTPLNLPQGNYLVLFKGPGTTLVRKILYLK